jgi:parallel beta-helix repeat protein
MPPKDVNYTANFGNKVYIEGTSNEYTSIQAAIDAATDGQTVIVCPGIYYENIELNNRSITLQSTDPSDSAVVSSTIVDGSGIGEVVTFLGGDTSTLEGFTIQNGKANSGAGIYVFSSTPLIRYNNIQTNTADYGGGIALWNNSQATITHNIVRDNTGIGSGGGFYVNNGFPSITHNTIEDNTSGFYGGGIYLYEYCDSTISNNTISGNQASDNGGGISIHHHSNPYIGSNTTIGNTATNEGGGIHMSHYCEPTLNLNNISNNSTIGTSGYVGGVYVENSSAPTISQNTIESNLAKYGCGIDIYENNSNPTYDPCELSKNTIEANNNTSTSMGGGIFILNSSNITISAENSISNNTATSAGGGMYILTVHHPLL